MLLVANWKMNLNAAGSVELARALQPTASLSKSTVSKSELWLAPSFTALPALSSALSGSSIELGAQNMHWEPKGAFTGEVSLSMLTEFAVSFVIIGHSERRHVFNENDSMSARRATAVTGGGLKCVFCVGETDSERSGGNTLAVLERQLQAMLHEVPSAELSEVILAYEPVWAIGSGKVASLADIEEAHSFLRNVWSRKSDSPVQILYGGSVTPENFAEIAASPQVDGALVGGASLVADKLSALMAICEANS